MKAGDIVGGYTPARGLPGGRRRAERVDLRRAGRTGVLPQAVPQPHLSATTPRRAAPPPKQRKRARCAAFEAHHRGIQAALAPITTYGGNLIATLDFFRDGAKYYKVTEKVELAGAGNRRRCADGLPGTSWSC